MKLPIEIDTEDLPMNLFTKLTLTSALTLSQAAFGATAPKAPATSSDDRVQAVLNDPQIKAIYSGSVNKWGDCVALDSERVSLDESESQSYARFRVSFWCQVSSDASEHAVIEGRVDNSDDRNVDLFSVEYTTAIED